MTWPRNLRVSRLAYKGTLNRSYGLKPLRNEWQTRLEFSVDRNSVDAGASALLRANAKNHLGKIARANLQRVTRRPSFHQFADFGVVCCRSSRATIPNRLPVFHR